MAIGKVMISAHRSRMRRDVQRRRRAFIYGTLAGSVAGIITYLIIAYATNK